MSDLEKKNTNDGPVETESSEPAYTRAIRQKQIKKDLQKETEEQFYD